jgi:hypothetical protein
MSEYWHLTRHHLKKATALLASGDDIRADNFSKQIAAANQ